LGKRTNDWQEIHEILSLFGDKFSVTRNRYNAFLESGIQLGRQLGFVKRGLMLSAGGWFVVRSLRKEGIFKKSDERILGIGEKVSVAVKKGEKSFGMEN
jgi:putative transposase